MTTSRAENFNYKIQAPPQHCFMAQIPNEYSSAAKSPEQGMTSPGGDKCGPVGDKDGPGSNVPLEHTGSCRGRGRSRPYHGFMLWQEGPARSVWCGVPAPVVQFLAFAQCAVRAPQDLEKAWERPKT